jgi:hypothetical protein
MTDKEQGPFHVSRSSDGEDHWFSARDAASGVTIPAKDRDDAYALVSSLNRACETFAARTNTELVEALREIAEPVPAEFEARGDPESGRVGKFYKAGRFDRAQDIARKALSLYGDERWRSNPSPRNIAARFATRLARRSR